MCVCVGGGGGLKNRDPIYNVGMIRYASSEDIHRAEWPTYGLTEIGTSFNDTGKTCERRRREPLWGSGGHAPPPDFQI